MSYYDTSTASGNYYANNNSNVWDDINSFLSDIGLAGLQGWARQTLVDYGSDLSETQFTQMIRETNEYKTRFKAIEIAKKNGFAVPTEAEVLATETAYRNVMQASGMPKDFYDSPDDFANLIGNGISAQEVQTRILDGYTAVRNDPAVQAQLSTLYERGATEGDLVAFFLDPDAATSAIEKRTSAAQISARGLASGFGQLNTNQAEKLAGQGVTAAQAQQGFAQLSQQRGLLSNLESEQGAIGTDTALAATFDDDADATDQLNRRLQERQARFTAGGGFTQNNSGGTGLGTARR